MSSFFLIVADEALDNVLDTEGLAAFVITRLENNRARRRWLQRNGSGEVVLIFGIGDTKGKILVVTQYHEEGRPQLFCKFIRQW